MKIILTTALLLLLAFQSPALSQRACYSYEYRQREISRHPYLLQEIEAVETHTGRAIKETDLFPQGTEQVNLISIPVVVHILYHYPEERITESQVRDQLQILNRDFRRMNADTSMTPQGFKKLAADCEIEFKLATSDPKSRATSGIIYKYSPVKVWENNDNMKFSRYLGDDAWDAASYLNIWVCRLDRLAGYSSFPGAPAGKDGIVIDFGAFGLTGNGAYGLGRTLVHEAGHWLNLNHTWGDTPCGDDRVSDTPPQSTYTVGCPSSVRISCNNGPLGDMYMNYMDFTHDACVNLFTLGQKARMRSLFAPGGSRNSILYSSGLGIPQNSELPLPDVQPKWLFIKIYPVPASNEITMDLTYDERWMGKTVSLLNVQGRVIRQFSITSRIQRVDISRLVPGVYFITSKKEDGEFMREKFIRQ